MKPQYQKTVYACFTGYIVQAIVNNFLPLLFLTFHNSYQIPMSRITLFITFNFTVQLLVDLLSARFVDRIGYRAAILIAHACAVAGLIGLAFLPDMLPSPFWGLLFSVTLYAVGGGLLEVMVSPIVEALPTQNKEASMSLLHSFYCWGCVGVVLLSTLFFTLLSIENWRILALLWALVPAGNLIAFTRVPLYTLLFALLALAGDIGCSGGPTYVGLVSGCFQDNFKTGILAAVVFPVMMIAGILSLRRGKASAAS